MHICFEAVASVQGFGRLQANLSRRVATLSRLVHVNTSFPYGCRGFAHEVSGDPSGTNQAKRQKIGRARIPQERSERGGHYREASALDMLHLLRSLSKIPKPILHSHEVSGTKLRRFL